VFEFPISGVETYWWLPTLVAFCISAIMSTGGVTGAFVLLPFSVSVLGYSSPGVSPTNLLYNVVAIPAGVWRFHRRTGCSGRSPGRPSLPRCPVRRSAPLFVSSISRRPLVQTVRRLRSSVPGWETDPGPFETAGQQLIGGKRRRAPRNHAAEFQPEPHQL